MTTAAVRRQKHAGSGMAEFRRELRDDVKKALTELARSRDISTDDRLARLTMHNHAVDAVLDYLVSAYLVNHNF